MMTPSEKANVSVMLDIFSAIERRDAQRLAELCQPDVELAWPAALPYGGTTRGLGTEPPTWIHTWAPLQPSEAERSMEPRVVASSGDEVVVLWRQRGRSPSGERFDGPVLAPFTRSMTENWLALRCSISTPRRRQNFWRGPAAAPPSSASAWVARHDPRNVTVDGSWRGSHCAVHRLERLGRCYRKTCCDD
jgi:ketosteroid isomerase-like protein